MDARTKFYQFVERQGLRHTGQREKILTIVLATEKHVSAQELYDLVQKKHKEIGYATVSRTLKLLADSGVCRIVDFGDGVHRYEHQYGHGHHDHLICTKCGMVAEIYSEELEEIQSKLVKKHGFVQTRHKLDIFGLCSKCKT
ncbi:MAG: transcriptional repressor [Phycisphaerae bacterium]|nr:transcriptional repressor [Phycisphaerae bacterium]